MIHLTKDHGFKERKVPEYHGSLKKWKEDFMIEVGPEEKLIFKQTIGEYKAFFMEAYMQSQWQNLVTR